jgi:prepilin-type N-terminal cleavage/methylation domain-containing protein
MTLMELMTVIVIISILAVLLYPTIGWYQERARRTACAENLKGLFAATTGYLTSNGGVWPQIPWSSKDAQAYAEGWYDILKPFGLSRSAFICLSAQRKAGNPDYNQKKFHRTDYIAMFFDDKPWTARKWDRQPWWTERQDMHGRGQLMVLANGLLIDLSEARRLGQQPQAAQ